MLNRPFLVQGIFDAASSWRFMEASFRRSRTPPYSWDSREPPTRPAPGVLWKHRFGAQGLRRTPGTPGNLLRSQLLAYHGRILSALKDSGTSGIAPSPLGLQGSLNQARKCSKAHGRGGLLVTQGRTYFSLLPTPGHLGFGLCLPPGNPWKPHTLY